MLRVRLMHCLLVLLCLPCAADDDFPTPVNTQAAGEHPPSPEEMLDLFELPDGFSVTLFAGEPDVQQPIAFDFDDRGRVWVAENYTYSSRGKIDPDLRDRVVILHDVDGDGQHDERKVFWDQGRMLTGLTWGFGGLWILNDGALAFLPDRNGDDVPDSEPIEMLNGWTKEAGHNFVNGLLWGPDGWLYGRHGITETSYPGLPDVPKAEREPMNCGIWRFHPTKHKFEIVCHGTTNPWGLDYNADGQMFMTNNVIGHLWHIIPGAHYERMFGQDFNPHLYELMPQTADHYHWDNTGEWSDSRDGSANDLGGGHSHCGGMIYHGENFPKEYRGKIFMCNTHGRCVNVNRLDRSGSGYVGKREPDFLKVNTPWFRGIELKSGPGGCVYLTDWSDNGECHDHDGVHRTSGRIYRISYGNPEPVGDLQLSKASTAEKTDIAINGDEWQARRCRRLLQEIGAIDDVAAVRTLAATADGPQALRAIQLLASVDSLDQQTVMGLLRNIGRAAVESSPVAELAESFENQRKTSKVLAKSDTARKNTSAARRKDEHVVSAAIQFGVERGFFRAPSDEAEILASHCSSDSALVLLTLASSLQKLDATTRGRVAERLVGRLVEIDDHNLTLMTWYGLLEEPSAAGLLDALSDRRVPPKLMRFVARRVVQMSGPSDAALGQLLSSNGPAQTIELQVAMLKGIQEGLRGQHRPEALPGWNAAQKRFSKGGDSELLQLTQQLAVLFGDGAALDDLRSLIADRKGDHAARSQAIATLGQSQDATSLPVMLSLLDDRAVYVDVASALANFNDPRIPRELLNRWRNLRHGSRQAAMDTLCSRKSYAVELANAIEDGRVDSSDMTATQVRQLMALNDPTITAIINEKWGVINDSSEARQALIASWTERLKTDVVAHANLENGAGLFKKSCASCHKLYGEGAEIGPDLTGSNRSNLDYLLDNVIDPSAAVPKQFTTSVIALESGRVITGVVVAETAQTLTLQTDKEEIVVAIADIEQRVRTNKSLMPDGLLDSLTEQQVRDLIAFVMKRR